MLVEIPVELITLEKESYHLLVKAKVDGMPVNLIIDTGASRTVFDYQSMKESAMEIQSAGNQTTSGINAMIDSCYFGVFKQLEFGELKIKDYSCTLMDLSHVNSVYSDYCEHYIHGLLGSDFLLKYKAGLSYKNMVLKLRHKTIKKEIGMKHP